MENKRLSFATVVASPNSASWSQSYTAGTLFAVVSLAYKDENLKEDLSLGTLGKEILNSLEAEYFTIETKNLSSIKHAFEIAIKPALQKEELVLSAGLLSITDNVLYITILGGTKVLMKRGDALGILLAFDEQEKQVVSASGFLQDNDVVVIETEQFGKIVPKEHLKSVIDHNDPLEVAENLSPLLHEQEEGGAAAVVISYKEPTVEEVSKGEEIQETFPQVERQARIFINFILSRKSFIKVNFDRKQKLFLSIALLLVLLLFGTGMFVLNQKEQAKNESVFQEVFEKAKTKYDEGQNLLVLNKNLARDDFQKAKKIILESKDKFPKNSAYEKQLAELLEKVENSLKAASGVNMVLAKQVNQNESELLAQVIKNTPLFVTQDEKNVYGINNDGVFVIDKKSKDKKTIIPNKNDWSDVGGLGVYLDNIYVLDRQKGQIFKFVGSEFTKSNYLVGTTLDFSNAISLTIDTSIFVLFENEIKKFTRGKQEEFKLSDLDKPLKNPSRIFTDTETNNLYILDNGNSRIVVFSKSGVYQTQYQAAVLKDAKEFDVLEKDKKIFVLSGGKLWQIDL